MKRIAKILLIIPMTATMLFGCSVTNQNTAPTEQQTRAAYQYLATSLNQPRLTQLDFWRVNSADSLKDDIEVALDAPVILNAMESVTFTIDTDEQSRAQLQALIRVTERTLINPILEMTLFKALRRVIS